MDLTKTNFRFSLALPLALLIALCTSANANAGAKIYKSVDSGGRVTFTDVPLLLSPQVIHGSKIANETPEPEVSTQPRAAQCLAVARSSCSTENGTGIISSRVERR